MKRSTPARLPALELLGLPLLVLTLWCGSWTIASSARAASSPREFSVSRACSAPAPGYAACLGLSLVPRHPLAIPGAQRRTSTPSAVNPRSSVIPGRNRASTPASGAPEAQPATHFAKPWASALTPDQLDEAYSLPTAPPTPQTIGIVDAYDDPDIAKDLAVYDEQYFEEPGPPACTVEAGVIASPTGSSSTDGCFLKVNQNGETGNYPKEENGWAEEIATDVEIAHGVCQDCRILLVEAKSASDSALDQAEHRAVAMGADEVSNSWGGPEGAGSTAENTSFKHPGVAITVAAGDSGYLDWQSKNEAGFADFPASSPEVVAVGGTRLELESGERKETVWNGAGATSGGCSEHFEAPPWQLSLSDWNAVGCLSKRAVADVSADGDPYTGVSFYDSEEDEFHNTGWGQIGGTSVASPIVAGVFALAGGAHEVSRPAETLYANFLASPGSFHDVTEGSNGSCGNGFNEETGLSECSLGEEGADCEQQAICVAGPAYDGPSGIGTPDGIAGFEPTGGQGIGPKEGGKEPVEKEPAKEPIEEEPAKEPGEEPVAKETPITTEKSSGGESGSGGGPGGTNSGAGSGSSGSGTGGSTGTGTAQAPTGNSPAGTASPRLVKLTGASLTTHAIVAVSRRRPLVSSVGFAFNLNVATKVRVKLYRRVRVDGRVRWSIVAPGAVTIRGSQGRDRGHLLGRKALPRGTYRLTFAPAGGATRTLLLVIG